jgi:NitT/TauT family transport system substrate-binding protein
LRLGHLTRITHASALVGIEKGLFADAIGPAAKLGVQPFGQSTEEVTALRSGHIDSASVGPNPALNAWQRSGGKAIKIISGWATGRSSLVVKPAPG